MSSTLAQTTIEDLVDGFANFGLSDITNCNIQNSSNLESLTNSLNNLSLNCETQQDVDELCAQVDKICISKML